MSPDFAIGIVIGLIIGLVLGLVIVLSQCEYNPAENKMWLRWSRPTGDNP